MRTSLIVVMCALLLAACAKKAEVSQPTSAPEGAASEASPAAPTSPEATAAGSQVLKVTLSALKGSEISGTATFTQSESGGTRVQVDLTGAGSTGELAAQIRSGTCADPGQIDVADTWQLSGGKADAPTFTNIGQLTAKPTVVVIIPMAAPAGSPGIFSCGQTTH